MLNASVLKRANPKQRRSKNLCADAGYRGKAAMKVILAHGYIPHVVSRKSEAAQKKRNPKNKARRWVVESCHGELSHLGIYKAHVDVFKTNDAARAYWASQAWSLRADIDHYSYISNGRANA